MLAEIQQTAQWIKERVAVLPRTAIVLGTGLGRLAAEIEVEQEFPYADIPHFPVSTVEGHSGRLLFGRLGGKEIMALEGRFHYYEGYDMKQVTFPVRVMYELGIRTLFVSNAAGGVNPDFEIGDLMLIRDHINFLPEHPLRGKNFPTGPRFPDMHEAYDHALLEMARTIAREKGIPVSNVPVYGTHSVSQFAIALLLEICHHIGHHDETVKAGKWEQCADWCYWDYPLIELAGKTYGLLGCGNIGVHTAAIASALGMKVIAYDSRQREEALALGVEYVELDELFARSDVLGLQMPLFPFNTGIINKETIAKMKDGVIIINNSRGQMVVEQDLADALNSGKVAAAGLDVVSTEPIRGDNPLLKAKNCILTPHISWAPKESRQRIMDCTVDNVRAYLAGSPINVVNP